MVNTTPTAYWNNTTTLTTTSGGYGYYRPISTGTASALTTVQWYGNSFGDNQWIPVGRLSMSNGPGSMNHRLWKQWNADYVKDKDEARRQAELEDARRQAAAHARVLATCVQAARSQGARLVEFAVARLDEYNDDEWRTVEDAHQRAYEERVEQDRAAVRVAAEKEEAARKAEVLLVSILTTEQKREWLEHKRVTHVSDGGRIWRLFPKWGGGVCLMNEAGTERRATLCLHTRDYIPEADNIAALLMSLRSGDEEHLVAIANLHAGEWTEDELQIRRDQRKARGPVIAPNVLQEIRQNAVRIEAMPA